MSRKKAWRKPSHLRSHFPTEQNHVAGYVGCRANAGAEAVMQYTFPLESCKPKTESKVPVHGLFSRAEICLETTGECAGKAKQVTAVPPRMTDRHQIKRLHVPPQQIRRVLLHPHSRHSQGDQRRGCTHGNESGGDAPFRCVHTKPREMDGRSVSTTRHR